jgi:hypothetical protein
VRRRILIGLAVRTAVAVFVLVAARLPGPPPSPRANVGWAVVVRQSIPPLLEPLYHWDAAWAADVALHGYSTTPDEHGYLSTGFQPVIPAIIAAAGYAAGWLVPLIAAAVGVAVFAQLVERLTGDAELADRTFWLLHLFPSALFLSCPYHEGIAVCATAVALAAWHRGSVSTTAAAGFVGTLAKSTGLSIAVAVAAEWLFTRPRPRFLPVVWVAVGCVLGQCVFLAVLWRTTGDPFANVAAHAAWDRMSPNPLNIPHAIYEAAVKPKDDPKYGDLAVSLLFIGLGVRSWVRRGPLWGMMTLFPMLLLLSTGNALSGQRVALVCLPAFVELADLLKSRLIFRTAGAVFLLMQLFQAWRYAHWVFAG